MTREFKPTILLLGCGYTLTRLLQRLPASKVVFTTRSDDSVRRAADLVGGRYEGMAVDLSSPSSIRDVFERFPTIETVFDSIPPLAEGDPTAGVKNVCTVLAERGVKRVVYLSTTGVYGAHDGQEVHEQSECVPTNSRAKARLASEEEYSRKIANFTAVRIAAIYGPGRGLGLALKNGTFSLIAGKDRISNRIHVEDLVETLLRLLSYRGIPPKVLCAADDAPTPIRQVVSHYCAKFNLPAPNEISEEQAEERQLYSQLSSQKVLNKLLKSELMPKLKFPSYKEGAGTELE